VADAKRCPWTSFSIAMEEVVCGFIFSPGMTSWFFFPVYWSGSNTKLVPLVPDRHPMHPPGFQAVRSLQVMRKGIDDFRRRTRRFPVVQLLVQEDPKAPFRPALDRRESVPCQYGWRTRGFRSYRCTITTRDLPASRRFPGLLPSWRNPIHSTRRVWHPSAGPWRRSVRREVSLQIGAVRLPVFETEIEHGLTLCGREGILVPCRIWIMERT